MGRHLSIINSHDFDALARERLDDRAWAYFSAGAADEITQAANCAAWSRLRLIPRPMRNLEGGNTRSSLLGRTLEHPILLAPVAYQRLAHVDGEVATALAAASLGAGFVLSSQTSVALQTVARLVVNEPSRGPLWFQIHLQADRGRTLELAEQARDAGFEALVLTVDAPVNGARDRERRAAFCLPRHIQAVHLPVLPNEASSSTLSRFDFAARHAARWSDIGWLARATGLPVLVKGLLHPDDAVAARDNGAAAVIVSNHGGRTLDTAQPTAEALAAIADRLRGTLPILVDGGVRRGTDVLKAIALGANAVLLGRPQVMALAANGAPGVASLLRLLRDELEIAMILTGCATLSEVNRSLLAD